MKLTRRAATVVLAGSVMVGMAGCAKSDRTTDSNTASGSSSAGSGGGTASDTFTFGAAGAPEVFDPYYASDGETFRITRQIFQGLLGIKPGTADPQPELAESWEPSKDGLSWTFKLRQGVKFTDGEVFNAAAVCYNFERMFDQNEVAQAGPAEYWAYTMLGFKGSETESLYKSCEAKDDSTAVINLTRYTSDFPILLTLESFSMQSPKALKDGDANNVQKEGDGFKYPAYAMAPVGTGPYKLSKYDEANKTITLVRNDDFWGDKAKTANLVFKVIPDESTRRQELEAGSINAYDLPNPADWKGLEEKGNQVLVRPAFNILYMGLNPEKNDKLQDIRVRKAIYMALNRDELVQTQLPEGAKVATQFMPDTVAGYNTALQPMKYDPEAAKALLKEAGAEGMTLQFAYPSEVSRPYMPDPQKIHDALRANLEAIGIKVDVVTKPWNGGYLDGVDNGLFDAWLLGWTGDYNSANNFIGTFFGSDVNDFHTWKTDFGKTLSKELDDANGIVDEGERTTAYEAVNKKIMEDYLPGLPISHSPPALVVGKGVEGLTASPLTAEMFDTVTVTKS
ncbi:ABC transporter substrate-binding protein [Nostocoides jenkinsii]|uniref:Oligopeptide/dipeptide ABC transporter,peptide-binding protein n=1 Tax=Nostocoides jenkinsii Ben 74 TaxID=1193518 RepID=A0A077M643_9MICO|nr:ABC transporter substrate-binding protein [Tetrasphaera jenkinsii]CCI52039.1 Oligopeptide/dipeptide ABC transporter,peptide-binding protein [Tetrasphaera jenkinsii Ben 74]